MNTNTPHDDMSTQGAFTYRPISAAKGEFRILDLEPVKRPEISEGTIRYARLEDKPEFFALSYVWGDPRNTIPIIVNGVSISVTRSLGKTLDRSRSTERVVPIWADAICINQADIDEKSFHVPMIRTIYEHAERVIVYLGDIGDSIDERDFRSDGTTIQSTGIPANKRHTMLNGLLDHYRFHGLNASEDYNSHNVLPGKNPFGDALRVLDLVASDVHFHELPFYHSTEECIAFGPTPLDTMRVIAAKLDDKWSRAVDALEVLLSQRWWNRAWVVQEALFAKVPPFVNFDKLSFDFSLPMAAAIAYRRHASSCCSNLKGTISNNDGRHILTAVLRPFMRLQECLELARSSPTDESFQSHTFRTVLDTGSQLNATEPRDHLYAMMGFLGEQKNAAKADYRRDVNDLWIETTIRAMVDRGWLGHSLRTCPDDKASEKPTVNTSQPPAKTLPSWCLDYAAGHFWPGGEFIATCDECLPGSLERNGIVIDRQSLTLKLRGCVLDTIKDIGPAAEASDTKEEVRNTSREYAVSTFRQIKNLVDWAAQCGEFREDDQLWGAIVALYTKFDVRDPTLAFRDWYRDSSIMHDEQGREVVKNRYEEEGLPPQQDDMFMSGFRNNYALFKVPLKGSKKQPRVFYTEKARFGVCWLASIEAGDHICMIKGLNVLAALRKVDGPHGKIYYRYRGWLWLPELLGCHIGCEAQNDSYSEDIILI